MDARGSAVRDALMIGTQVVVTCLLALSFGAGGYLFGSIAGMSWGALAVVVGIGLVVALLQSLAVEGFFGFFRFMNWAWNRGTDRARPAPVTDDANLADAQDIWWHRITYCLYALAALGFVSGYLNPFGVAE